MSQWQLIIQANSTLQFCLLTNLDYDSKLDYTYVIGIHAAMVNIIHKKKEIQVISEL